MNCKKLLSLILAFAMVFSLTACTTQPDPTEAPTAAPTTPPTEAPTTPPTTPPTEPPTEPATEPPPPEMLYNDAVELLNNTSDITMTVRMKHTVTVDGAIYEESSTQTISYAGYGTEAFTATATDEVNLRGYTTTYDEIFKDGILYTTMDGALHFKGEMTVEEYTSRFVPLVLLDAALYGTITEENMVLTFSDPTTGEGWIVPEYGNLEEATGTMSLNNDGSVKGFTYDVTYSIGGAEICYNLQVDIDPTVGEIPTVDETIEYTELEFVYAPRFMEQAVGYLLQPTATHSVSASMVESIVTQAGGAMRNQSTIINSWSAGGEYLGAVDLSIYLMHSAGTESYEQEERFVDNAYTITVDGGAPQANSGVTARLFEDYCIGALTSAFPSSGYLTGCTATDLGSIYFLELTFSEELALALEDGIASMFWSDEAFLDDMAEDYRTETMTGYLSIDKNTGLPLALGYYFEGYHTLDGYEYMISLQQDQSFDLVSMDAYEAIMEEGPVPAEPEEKATPLFYHVTGEDGQEMWLLGTIHIGDARTSYLPQEIYDAFDAADALAVEFNSEAFDQEMEENEEFSDEVTSLYFYDDGTTAKDHVKDEELFRYAEMYMKATGNYHMNAPYMKISLWSNSIDNFFRRQSYGLSSSQGVDNQLIWRAQNQDKEILDVESGLFQTQMITGFSEGLQELLLKESVYSDPYGYVLSTWELFEMWCAGDEATLIAYLNDEGEDDEPAEEDPEAPTLSEEELGYLEEYDNAMGTDRNDDMHDVAVSYLESGKVVFYAVGLAHLLAEDGLVNTLRAAGYTVELVSYE